MSLFNHGEMAIETKFKAMRLWRLYRETGNEFYKILAEGYDKMAETCLPSKLYREVARKPIRFEACKEVKEMKQFRLEHGFFYLNRYIPALDYTIEDFGNGERYLTGMDGNVPVSIKLTKGLEEALEQQLNNK